MSTSYLHNPTTVVIVINVSDAFNVSASITCDRQMVVSESVVGKWVNRPAFKYLREDIDEWTYKTTTYLYPSLTSQDYHIT